METHDGGWPCDDGSDPSRSQGTPQVAENC